MWPASARPGPLEVATWKPVRLVTPVLLALVAVLAGCAPHRPATGNGGPVEMVRDYFAANNAAARRGPRAQQEFLRHRQHPDFSGQVCELGRMTVTVEPAMPTLRRDPEFTADGVRPSGTVWVVGVEVTVRRNRVVIGRHIGSQHLVVLGGRLYGFAPCPT